MRMERGAGVVRMMGWASRYLGDVARAQEVVDEGGESVLLSGSSPCRTSGEMPQ
jgi:hypothetical protein